MEPDEIEPVCDRHFHGREPEHVDRIPNHPKFAAAGISALHEVAYAFGRK
jgi:hypothetical protein